MNPPLSQQPAVPAPRGLRFVEAFRFLFDQPNALNNVLLGAVLNIIPIVGPMVLMGWQCEIIQRLIRRHPHPLPKFDFSDFGYWLGRGVVPFLVTFLISLPLTFLIFLFFFAGMMGTGLVAANMQRYGGEPSPFFIFGGIAVMALFFLALMLPVQVFMMSALLRAELTEDFGKAFEIGKIFAFARRTWKEFALIYLVVTPIFFLMIFAGMFILFVGMYLVIVMMNFTYLHLRWQVYEKYLGEGGEPIPIQTKSGPLPSETPRPPARTQHAPPPTQA